MYRSSESGVSRRDQRIRFQKESARRVQAEETAHRAARKVVEQDREAQRRYRAASKIGTVEVHNVNALQQEYIDRRLNEDTTGADESEALRLAGLDIKDSLVNPFIKDVSVVPGECAVHHLPIHANYKDIWAHCFKCSTRLISEYFMCLGCLHAAWCSEKCYDGNRVDHLKVRISKHVCYNLYNGSLLFITAFHHTRFYTPTHTPIARLTIAHVAGVPQHSGWVDAPRAVPYRVDTHRNCLQDRLVRCRRHTHGQRRAPDH